VARRELEVLLAEQLEAELAADGVRMASPVSGSTSLNIRPAPGSPTRS
jgi:hypothetical protein